MDVDVAEEEGKRPMSNRRITTKKESRRNSLALKMRTHVRRLRRRPKSRRGKGKATLMRRRKKPRRPRQRKLPVLRETRAKRGEDLQKTPRFRKIRTGAKQR